MTAAIFPDRRFFRHDELRFAYYEAGLERGTPLVFLHGTPEIAYSWRFQLPFFATEGFRSIAIDARGHGWSDSARRWEAYDIEHLAGDIIAALDHLDIADAVLIGHDTGVAVAHHIALMAPERVKALVAIGAPLQPPLPFSAIDEAKKMFGERHPLVVLQGPANDEVARLDANPRELFEKLLRRNTNGYPMILDVLGSDEIEGEELLGRRELDVYDEAFSRTGFRGMASSLRHARHNAERHAPRDQRITVPTLWIRNESGNGSPDRVSGLIDEHLADYTIAELEGVGHWIQQEAPTLLNHVLLQWLIEKLPLATRPTAEPAR